MLFFTADTHFRETRGIAIDRRPFASVKEQDETLIANWNAAVAPDDTIWHLGDFGRGPTEEIDAILARLNGEKHLIIGNNDPQPTRAAAGWASVSHYHELRVSRFEGAWHPATPLDPAPDETRLLVLGHYAFRTWNLIGKGSINLHGHSHGRLKPITRQLDVGVDAHNFTPVSLDAIMARLIHRHTKSPAHDRDSG